MIEDLDRARTPGSAALYAKACRALPADLTHDSRATAPPIYVAREVAQTLDACGRALRALKTDGGLAG